MSDNLKGGIPGTLSTDEKDSGFFDLPKDKTCRHPEHDAPKYMVIPKGKGYRHVCPYCGEVQVIIPQQTTL